MTRRLPPELKAAKGTLRPAREAKALPPRLHGTPTPPKTLSAAGRSFWALVTKILKARHQLGIDSGPALTALCEVYQERLELTKVLEEEGRFQTLTTTKGDKVRKAHPGVAMLRDADARFHAWLREFGLTDASRAGVNAIYIQPQPPKEPRVPKSAKKPGERYGLS